VKSPNPAFSHVEVPLASTFMLSTKPGKEAYVEPVIDRDGYRFTVKVGKPKDPEAAKAGTKLSRGANFACVMSGTPMEGDYIKAEGKAGKIGARLMAIVAEGIRGRIYISPTLEHEAAAKKAKPEWRPDVEFFQQALGFRVGNYGMTKWSDLFTDRQTSALTKLADVAREVRDRVQLDATAGGMPNDTASFDGGGCGSLAYADAVAVCLAFALDKSAVYWNSLCPWLNQPKNEIVGNSFSRQTVQMLWDYAEANPFCDSGGNISKQLEYIGKYFDDQHAIAPGYALQADAAVQSVSTSRVISTDPPYYDNIGYADLSDFFYVWLRRALKPMFPLLFATLAVPKVEELVATPHRHGGTEKAETFFLEGMTKAMHRLAQLAHPAFPITIYYAFKQAEGEEESGTSSTGWETFLDAVIRAGFAMTGTWPMRTERPGRMRDFDSNALASSIVLVCNRRDANAPMATRKEFVATLQREMPEALRNLQLGNLAPVDLPQSAIGPGMGVFTRYSKVIEADGSAMTVRSALQLINAAIDEFLSAQESQMDDWTRFAVTWFSQQGYQQGPFGNALNLATARNISVDGVRDAGILESGAGKVRLYRPSELDAAWDPASDARLTIWEIVHQMIRLLAAEGEGSAAKVLSKVGALAEDARSLCYRLYTICEQKKWADEARDYNTLIVAWPELTRLAADQSKPVKETQGDLGV
jgi:putative DNA methylase